MVSELTSFGPISMATTPDAALHEILQCLQDLRRCLKNPAPISKTTANPDSFDATMTNPVPISSPLLPKPPDPPDFNQSGMISAIKASPENIEASSLSNHTSKTRKKKIAIPLKYSCDEIYDRMTKGLCIFCEEQDNPDHQLKHKGFQIFIKERDDQLSDDMSVESALEEIYYECVVKSVDLVSVALNQEGEQGMDQEEENPKSTVQDSSSLPNEYQEDSATLIKSSHNIQSQEYSCSHRSTLSSFEMDQCASDRNCNEQKRSSCLSRGDRIWEPGGLSAKLEPEKYHTNSDMLELILKLRRVCLQQNTNAGCISQNFGFDIDSRKLNIWISQSPSQTLGDHNSALMTPYPSQAQSRYELDTIGFNVLATHEEKMLGILTSCELAENFEKLTKSWRFKFKGKIEKSLLTGEKLMFSEQSRKGYTEEEGYSKLQNLVDLTWVKSEHKQLGLSTVPKFQILHDYEAKLHGYNLLEAVLLQVQSLEKQKKFHKTWNFKYKCKVSSRDYKTVKPYKLAEVIGSTSYIQGSVDNSFDVLAALTAEMYPIDLDHIIEAWFFYFSACGIMLLSYSNLQPLLVPYSKLLCSLCKLSAADQVKWSWPEKYQNHGDMLEITPRLHGTCLQTKAETASTELSSCTTYSISEFQRSTLSNSGTGIKEFEMELQQVNEIKAMVETGKIKDAIDPLRANYVDVKAEFDRGLKGIKQFAILDIVVVGYMAVENLKPVLGFLDKIHRIVVRIILAAIDEHKGIRTACILLEMGINGDIHKVANHVNGCEDEADMKLSDASFHMTSLRLLYGSLPRPPDFRTINRSFERPSMHEKGHKLLFPKNHTLLHPRAGFWTRHNDMEQLSTELQSSPGVNCFTHLMFIWNQALNFGCKADHISGIFSVDGFHEFDTCSKLKIGNETQGKRLLILAELFLLDIANEADLVVKKNWFHSNPTIEELFHLQRPPELLAEKACISSLRTSMRVYVHQISSLRTRMFSTGK